MDQAAAGDEAVAVDHLFVHAEVMAAVAHQLVGFLEGPLVEQKIDALASVEFTFLVLARPALLSASSFGRGVAAAEFLQAVGHKNPGGNPGRNHAWMVKVSIELDREEDGRFIAGG